MIVFDNVADFIRCLKAVARPGEYKVRGRSVRASAAAAAAAVKYRLEETRRDLDDRRDAGLFVELDPAPSAFDLDDIVDAWSSRGYQHGEHGENGW